MKEILECNIELPVDISAIQHEIQEFQRRSTIREQHRRMTLVVSGIIKDDIQGADQSNSFCKHEQENELNAQGLKSEENQMHKYSSVPVTGQQGVKRQETVKQRRQQQMEQVDMQKWQSYLLENPEKVIELHENLKPLSSHHQSDQSRIQMIVEIEKQQKSQDISPKNGDHRSVSVSFRRENSPKESDIEHQIVTEKIKQIKAKAQDKDNPLSNEEIVEQTRKVLEKKRKMKTMRKRKSIRVYDVDKFISEIEKARKGIFTVHGKSVRYDPNSLNFFNEKTRFRYAMVYIVEAEWFKNLILAIIILNSIVMTQFDYSDRELESKGNQINELLGIIFSYIFLVEAIIKIIAQGFVQHQNSYLKDQWNWIDFFVVLTSLPELFFDNNAISNFRSLRILRVLRPLKTIKAIPGMRRLVITLVGSVPDLGNFVVFLVYFIWLFAIAGLQLFCGEFSYRCRLTEFPTENNTVWELDLDQVSHVCNALDQSNFYQCNEGTYCGNPRDYGLSLDIDEPYRSMMLNYDILTFNNIFTSILCVFESLTLEGWTSLMYQIQDAGYEEIGSLYMITTVIFGAYFILNLNLAVIMDAFNRQEELLLNQQTNMDEFKTQEELDHLLDKVKDEARHTLKSDKNEIFKEFKKNLEIEFQTDSSDISPIDEESSSSGDYHQKSDSSKLKTDSSFDDEVMEINHNKQLHQHYLQRESPQNQESKQEEPKKQSKEEISSSRVYESHGNTSRNNYIKKAKTIRYANERGASSQANERKKSMMHQEGKHVPAVDLVNLGFGNTPMMGKQGTLKQKLNKIMRQENHLLKSPQGNFQRAPTHLLFDNVKPMSGLSNKNNPRSLLSKMKQHKTFMDLDDFLENSRNRSSSFQNQPKILSGHNSESFKQKTQTSAANDTIKSRQSQKQSAQSQQSRRKTQLLPIDSKLERVRKDQKHRLSIAEQYGGLEVLKEESMLGVEKSNQKIGTTPIDISSKNHSNAKQDGGQEKMILDGVGLQSKIEQMKFQTNQVKDLQNMRFDKKDEMDQGYNTIGHKVDKNLNEFSFNNQDDEILNKNILNIKSNHVKNKKSSTSNQTISSQVQKNQTQSSNKNYEVNNIKLHSKKGSMKTSEIKQSNNQSLNDFQEIPEENQRNRKKSFSGSRKQKKEKSKRSIDMSNLNLDTQMGLSKDNLLISQNTLQDLKDNKHEGSGFQVTEEFQESNGLVIESLKRQNKIRDAHYLASFIRYPCIIFIRNSLIKPIRKVCLKIVESQKFEYLIQLLIFLNTILLMFDKYPIDYELNEKLDYYNNILSFCFLFELIIKLIGLGFKNYFLDSLNIFDLFVVLVSMVEILFSSLLNTNANLTLFRGFRLIKIFKLARSWTSFQVLILQIVKTLNDISNFLILLSIFIVAMTIIGMELFGFMIKIDVNGNIVQVDEFTHDNTQFAPRVNFDNFTMACLTIFICLIGEDWPIIMHQYMQLEGKYTVAVIYFMILMIVGNLFLMNLFLAILLKNFETIDDDQKKQEEQKQEEENDQLRKSQSMGKSFKMVSAEKQSILLESIKDSGEQKRTTLSHLDVKFNTNLSASTIQNANRRMSQAADRHLLHYDRKKMLDEFNSRSQAGSSRSRESIAEEFSNRDHHPIRKDTELSVSNKEINKDILKAKENLEERKKQEEYEKRIQERILHGTDKQLKAFNIISQMYEKTRSRQSMKKGNIFDQYTYSSAQHKSQKQKITQKAEIIKTKKALVDLDGKSLFLFSKDNAFRNFLYRMQESTSFEFFIQILIIISMIMLAFDTPIADGSEQIHEVSFLINEVVVVLFFLEMLIKIISYGFIFNGKNSYLKNYWNIMDFIIVITSLLHIYLSITIEKQESTNLSVDQNLIHIMAQVKMLRVLRTLRMITHNEGLKIIVMSIVYSIPGLFNVLIITLFFIIMFGILFTNILKGKLYYCSYDEDWDLVINFQEQHISKYSGNYNKYDASEGIYFIDQKWDCENYGGTWVNQPLSFDNIQESVITLFVMTTTEGWVDFLFYSMQSRGIDYQPYDEIQTKSYALLFGFFIVICSIFILNMFIQVLVINFYKENEKIFKNFLFTDFQQEWIRIQLDCYKVTPIKRVETSSAFRSFFLEIVTHDRFDQIINTLIILNGILLSTKTSNSTEDFLKTLDFLQQILIFIFFLECVMKLIAQGRIYFSDYWNVFDFILVLFGLPSIYIYFVDNDSSNNLNLITVLRIIRICRIFRLVRSYKRLKTIFLTFIYALPQLGDVFFLLVLVLYIFAVLCTSLYSFVMWETFDYRVNFQYFLNSITTLFHMTTGEGWYNIMINAGQKYDLDFQCEENADYNEYIANGKVVNGCGSPHSYGVFILFMTLSMVILVNLFVAVTLQAFDNISQKQDQRITESELVGFAQIFSKYDPKGTGFINIKNLSDCILEAIEQDLDLIPKDIAMIIEEDNNMELLIDHLELQIYKDYTSYNLTDILCSMTTLKLGVIANDPDEQIKINSQVIEEYGDPVASFNELVELIDVQGKKHTIQIYQQLEKAKSNFQKKNIDLLTKNDKGYFYISSHIISIIKIQRLYRQRKQEKAYKEYVKKQQETKAQSLPVSAMQNNTSSQFDSNARDEGAFNIKSKLKLSKNKVHDIKSVQFNPQVSDIAQMRNESNSHSIPIEPTFKNSSIERTQYNKKEHGESDQNNNMQEERELETYEQNHMTTDFNMQQSSSNRVQILVSNLNDDKNTDSNNKKLPENLHAARDSITSQVQANFPFFKGNSSSSFSNTAEIPALLIQEQLDLKEAGADEDTHDFKQQKTSLSSTINYDQKENGIKFIKDIKDNKKGANQFKEKEKLKQLINQAEQDMHLLSSSEDDQGEGKYRKKKVFSNKVMEETRDGFYNPSSESEDKVIQNSRVVGAENDKQQFNTKFIDSDEKAKQLVQQQQKGGLSLDYFKKLQNKTTIDYQEEEGHQMQKEYLNGPLNLSRGGGTLEQAQSSSNCNNKSLQTTSSVNLKRKRMQPHQSQNKKTATQQTLIINQPQQPAQHPQVVNSQQINLIQSTSEQVLQQSQNPNQLIDIEITNLNNRVQQTRNSLNEPNNLLKTSTDQESKIIQRTNKFDTQHHTFTTKKHLEAAKKMSFSQEGRHGQMKQQKTSQSTSQFQVQMNNFKQNQFMNQDLQSQQVMMQGLFGIILGEKKLNKSTSSHRVGGKIQRDYQGFNQNTRKSGGANMRGVKDRSRENKTVISLLEEQREKKFLINKLEINDDQSAIQHYSEKRMFPLLTKNRPIGQQTVYGDSMYSSNHKNKQGNINQSSYQVFNLIETDMNKNTQPPKPKHLSTQIRVKSSHHRQQFNQQNLSSNKASKNSYQKKNALSLNRALGQLNKAKESINAVYLGSQNQITLYNQASTDTAKKSKPVTQRQQHLLL